MERTCPRSRSSELADPFSGVAREKHGANNLLLGRKAAEVQLTWERWACPAYSMFLQETGVASVNAQIPQWPGLMVGIKYLKLKCNSGITESHLLILQKGKQTQRTSGKQTSGLLAGLQEDFPILYEPGWFKGPNFLALHFHVLIPIWLCLQRPSAITLLLLHRSILLCPRYQHAQAAKEGPSTTSTLASGETFLLQALIFSIDLRSEFPVRNGGALVCHGIY